MKFFFFFFWNSVPKQGSKNLQNRFFKLLILPPSLQEREGETKKYLHHSQFVSLTENVIGNVEELPWFVNGWKE